MEGLNQQDMLQTHGSSCIKLPLTLTGRQKLTYTFIMDPRIPARTMVVKMSGMVS